jgi:hypothetical protein
VSFEDAARAALEHAWGRALDVSQSKDFRYEDGTLNEDEYLRARENILAALTAELVLAHRHPDL